MVKKMSKGNTLTTASKLIAKKPEPKSYGIQTGTEILSGGGIPRICKNICIVGFAPSSMEDAQFYFGDPEWEIWPLNQLYMAWPRILPENRMPERRNVTRWFQIHHRHSYDQTVSRDHSHHEWLGKQTDFPIYMQKKEPDIPASVTFPVQGIIDFFKRRYFTNSISWMVALAIYEAVTMKIPDAKIAMMGVDMAQDSEFAFERPSVEWMLGWAEGAGIQFILPQKSDILKTIWLYPFEDDAPMRSKIEARRIELRGRINQSLMVEQQTHDERCHLQGALENMSYIERSWVASVKDQDLLKQ